MVDDRYGWLDEDVAERLLRGEPLDFADGTGRRRRRRWSPEDRAAAERLAAVLARVAEAGRPGENGRAPGEQAALAAFRAAQESADRASAAEFAAESPFDGGGRERRRSGALERLRSLRMSVVGAVAACAIGGVAVASSAGVLPAPSFIEDTGGSRSPSVGATSSADTRDGDGRKEGSAAVGGHDSRDGGEDSGSGKDGDDPRAEGGGAGTGADMPGRGVIGDIDGRQPTGGPDENAVLDAACRDYLAAQAGTGPTPGQGRMRLLEQKAGSPAAVASYCTDRLGTTAGTSGGATGGATGGDHEEPASPSPSVPSSPGGDASGGGTGGDTGGGGSTGGDDEPEGGPSSSPSVGISEAPSASESAGATASASAPAPTDSVLD